MAWFFTSDLHGRPGRYATLLDQIRREGPRAVLLGGDLLPHGLDATAGGAVDFSHPALDLLRAEWDDYPHKSGAEDYLHEAAQADDPRSETFYDPNHPGDEERLASLGVHEHWNNPEDKKYSRNLGTGEGIELVSMGRT